MSIAGRTLGLIQSLDGLFEEVVLRPDDWDDRAFGDWMESVVADGESLDRDALKILQRGVRRAQRLRRHWTGRTDGPPDWRMRVDEVLGSAGWRPTLELAEWGMSLDSDPELFTEMARRFRAVNFAPLPVSFEEWAVGRGTAAADG